MRIAVEVVDRAVERVDDPADPAAAASFAAFLGDQRVLGPLPPDALDDRAFGGVVRIRDEVGRAGLRAELPRRCAEPLDEERAGRARGVDGDAERLVGTQDGQDRCAPGRPSSIVNDATVLTVAAGCRTVDTARKSATTRERSRVQRT